MRTLLTFVTLFASTLAAVAQTTATETPIASSDLRTTGLAVSAALAIGMSVVGAAFAVARVGSAAMGAAAEKPELLTRALVFVALAEGLAVLGFVIAIMILQKI